MSSPTFYVHLIAGVPLSEILQKVTEEREITKYHEDTGEPYKYKVKFAKTLLFGQVFKDPDEEPDNWVKKETGLDCVGSGESEDTSTYFVGVPVAHTKRPYGDSSLEVTQTKIVEAMNQARVKLQERYPAGETVNVRLYLVTYMSW